MRLELEKKFVFKSDLEKHLFSLYSTFSNQIIPTDPAVKPTARKKTNSAKSLGNEFTIKLR